MLNHLILRSRSRTGNSRTAYCLGSAFTQHQGLQNIERVRKLSPNSFNMHGIYFGALKGLGEFQKRKSKPS